MPKSVRYRDAYMKYQYCQYSQWELGYDQNNLSNTWYAMDTCMHINCFI